MKVGYVVYPISRVREEGKTGEYKNLDYIPDSLQFDVYEAAAMPDTVTFFAKVCRNIGRRLSFLFWSRVNRPKEPRSETARL